MLDVDRRLLVSCEGDKEEQTLVSCLACGADSKNFSAVIPVPRHSYSTLLESSSLASAGGAREGGHDGEHYMYDEARGGLEVNQRDFAPVVSAPPQRLEVEKSNACYLCHHYRGPGPSLGKRGVDGVRYRCLVKGTEDDLTASVTTPATPSSCTY